MAKENSMHSKAMKKPLVAMILSAIKCFTVERSKFSIIANMTKTANDNVVS